MVKLITREMVADQLSAYLRHELSVTDRVAWAESALMAGEFNPAHLSTIRDVVARIGVTDVRAFGLTWEDCGASRRHLAEACPHYTKTSEDANRALLHESPTWPPAEAGEQLLSQLGYSAQVSIVAR